MRTLGEFDRLDDELFSERLDYREGSPAAAVVPEPPTVRLGDASAVPGVRDPGFTVVSYELNLDPFYNGPEPSGSSLDLERESSHPHSEDEVTRRVSLQEKAPERAEDQRAEDRESDRESDRDSVLAVALAGLLVLVLIVTGVVLWYVV